MATNYVISLGISAMAETFSVGEPSMKLIVDGLQQPIGYDMRESEC